MLPMIVIYTYLIMTLPLKYTSLILQAFLLNMQISFIDYCFKISIKINNLLGFKKIQINELPDHIFENLNVKSLSFVIKNDDSFPSESSLDQYDFTGLVELFFDFFYIYKWFLLPIILFIGIIYMFHGLFGLYSAYVDYFQKNPDHIDSYRAFIPAFFIFLFFIFIFFSLIFFVLGLYLYYIIWFLFI